MVASNFLTFEAENVMAQLVEGFPQMSVTLAARPQL